ncbi:GspH/FimT family pseudopilin [Zooshikella ganghwensis]|uniref:GspH/FimT family pseudopilin n=1 Tax=Zooshikella ganghwensis TaxID=202772 RepID=UPI000688CE70|nr:GspH/FimT family pseudopilin [Zooshikella ganghwensis]
MSKIKGFTLIELMVTVAVISILATIAVPSLTSFINQNRVNSSRDVLISTINMARSEAVNRNKNVVMCGLNAASNGCSGSLSFNNGVLVFVDKNSNQVYNSADDTLLKKVSSNEFYGVPNISYQDNRNIQALVINSEGMMHIKKDGNVNLIENEAIMSFCKNESKAALILKMIGNPLIKKKVADCV